MNNLVPAKAGWQATLRLVMASVKGQTRLVRAEHVGPLRVQQPFTQVDGSTHIYILHPPGGLVGGDHLAVNITGGQNSSSLFTSPSAGKFYRCQPTAGGQRMNLAIRIEDGAHLEWLPQETIFFDGARALVENRILLEGTATYLGWDIVCLGRRASGEDYRRGELAQETRVHQDDRLIHRERLVFATEMQEARWGLAGKSVVGTLVAVPRERDGRLLDGAVSRMRASMDARFLGITRRDRTVLVRYLGDSAEACRRAFERARQQLRCESLFNAGQTTESPRIWNT